MGGSTVVKIVVAFMPCICVKPAINAGRSVSLECIIL